MKKASFAIRIAILVCSQSFSNDSPITGWNRVSLDGTKINISLPSSYVADNSFGQFKDENTGIFVMGIGMPSRQNGKVVTKQDWQSQARIRFNNPPMYSGLTIEDTPFAGIESFIATMTQTAATDTFYKAAYFRFQNDSVFMIILTAPQTARYSLYRDYKEIFKSASISSEIKHPDLPFTIQLPPEYKFLDRHGLIYVFKNADVDIENSPGAISILNEQVFVDGSQFKSYVKSRIKTLDARLAKISILKFKEISNGFRSTIDVELLGNDKSTGKRMTAFYTHILENNEIWTVESYNNSGIKSAKFFEIAKTFSLKGPNAGDNSGN